MLKGLVTDRQIATKVVASGRDPAKVEVSQFMTKDPVTVSPEMDVHEAVEIMGSQGYRRIPVSEGGKPIGILSNCRYCRTRQNVQFVHAEYFQGVDESRKITWNLVVS